MEKQENSSIKNRVLVVDDDPGIRELLKFKLISQGYEAMTAKDANEFQAMAMNNEFNLIILDIWLKGKFGTDVYCDLLEAGLDRKIPVVFVSALVEDFPPSHVREGHQYAVYGKPIDLGKLMSDIHLLLDSQPNQGSKKNRGTNGKHSASEMLD